MKNEGSYVLHGSESSDKFYLLESNIAYYASNVDNTDLWHKRLGHLNYTDLVKLTKLDDVRGIPKLIGRPEGLCGSCQKG